MIFLTKFYFHPTDGYIDIKININKEIKFFALNKNQWKNDLSEICAQDELILNQDINQTNLWSLSRSFILTDEIYFILNNCNSSLDISDGSYTFILTNGFNSFTKHFSYDEQGKNRIEFNFSFFLLIILFRYFRIIYCYYMYLYNIFPICS